MEALNLIRDRKTTYTNRICVGNFSTLEEYKHVVGKLQGLEECEHALVKLYKDIHESGIKQYNVKETDEYE